MFGRRFSLFKILGFEVRLDASWFFIAILVTWSLAEGFFPYYNQDLSPQTYWLMGALGAVGLFVSIVLHELSHALVARRYGLRIDGITLFIFGGVAEMRDEPNNAKTEFMMAIAGPLASVALAAGFFVLRGLTEGLGWPAPATAVIGYLAMINGLLAAFNMLPAFPLDGGRVLRAALWSWKGSVQWATRIVSQIGAGFGLVMLVVGVFSVVSGNFIGGLWWCLIGLFLRNAAQMSYRQMLLRRHLQGEPVSRFMTASPITVPPGITLRELVDDYVYRFHFKMFPVVSDAKLRGCITTQQLHQVPKEQWDSHRVEEFADSCSSANTISPRADATEALARMSQTGASRLMVVDGERLVGIISLKDLMQFLSLKIDLEGT